MKKSIVLVLLLLALVVIVSPALIGHLAEKSVDRQLQWAAKENREVVVTSEKFDRGWFSSEGRHRIEFGDSAAGVKLKQQLGFDPGEPTPALIVDTHLDHGLIPVSSIARTEGSLLPGLGRAVSTVSFESASGEVTELPGVIYSKVGLDGGLVSRYFLEAGSINSMRWGAGALEVASDARARHITIDGGFDSFSLVGEDQSTYSLGNFELTTDMTTTGYGYAVGDMSFAIDSVNIASRQTTMIMGPLTMTANTELDGDRINGTSTMEFSVAGLPPIGDIDWSMDMTMRGLDAAAVGRVQRALDNVPQTDDPMAMFSLVENDLKDIAARGFDIRFDELDITLPQGTLDTKLLFSLPETDRPSFAWTGVLLDLEATADIRVSAGLYDFVAMMNPQLDAAVATGFLKADGDDYEMAAKYSKGLLTVNGAPIPIPLPQL